MSFTAEPLISIVVPSFNQGKFIEETLCSILGQNYKNLELIVIDGGSTDETLDVIKKYSSQIAYFVSEADNGQASAINKGFRVAKGDVLAWLNSDDMYLPCTLMKVASYFQTPGELKLVYGGTLHFFEGKSSAYGFLPSPFNAERLTYSDYIMQSSTFWSRSLWEKVGELQESYNYVLDWDWFIRASKVCEFIPVADYLSLYRFHDAHKSGTGEIKRIDEILSVVNDYADSKWIEIYQGLYQQLPDLRKKFSHLRQLNLYPLRYLSCPRLYRKYGKENLDFALNMFYLPEFIP